jgi:hypothetical protein
MKKVSKVMELCVSLKIGDEDENRYVVDGRKFVRNRQKAEAKRHWSEDGKAGGLDELYQVVLIASSAKCLLKPEVLEDK